MLGGATPPIFGIWVRGEAGEVLGSGQPSGGSVEAP